MNGTTQTAAISAGSKVRVKLEAGEHWEHMLGEAVKWFHGVNEKVWEVKFDFGIHAQFAESELTAATRPVSRSHVA